MLFCHHCYNEWNLSQNFTPACAITKYCYSLSLKSKYLIFKLASTMRSGFMLLPASHDGSGLTFGGS